MKTALFDGSPKTKESSSEFILRALEEKLREKSETLWLNARSGSAEENAAVLSGCEAVVLAFPLYVDGIPSHLLRRLVELEPLLKAQNRSLKVYVLVNSGFYEARQNNIALAMMKQWCEHSGLAWMQGFGAGAGGMAQAAPAGRGPAANLGRALDTLADNLLAGTGGEDVYFEPNFPRFLYKAIAHMGWRMQAKENGVRSEMGKRHTYVAKSTL